MILQQFVSGPRRGGDGRDEGGGHGPTDTPPDASTLGVKILLASLTMLFGATMIAYLVVRLQNRDADWTGYRQPGLGLGLIGSTVVLVALSVVLHGAIGAARRGLLATIFPRLIGAFVLALTFLGNQIHNWFGLARARGAAQPGIAELLFWILTVTHALHVVGGLPPLIVTMTKSARGRYSATNWRGLWNCALYWHFLDAVWIVIAIVLWIG